MSKQRQWPFWFVGSTLLAQCMTIAIGLSPVMNPSVIQELKLLRPPRLLRYPLFLPPVVAFTAVAVINVAPFPLLMRNGLGLLIYVIGFVLAVDAVKARRAYRAALNVVSRRTGGKNLLLNIFTTAGELPLILFRANVKSVLGVEWRKMVLSSVSASTSIASEVSDDKR